MTLLYTDTLDRQWTLRDCAVSMMPGFIRGTRDDGVRVLVSYVGNNRLTLPGRPSNEASGRTAADLNRPAQRAPGPIST